MANASEQQPTSDRRSESTQPPKSDQQTAREAARQEPEHLDARPFPARARAQQPGDKELRLTRAAWKERAAVHLGVSPHAVAGALALHDPEEEIPESKVHAALDEFSVRRGV